VVLRHGRFRLQVLAPVQGHSPADLLLWDAGTRLLIAGGLVSGEHTPQLAAGGLRGWLARLPQLRSLAPQTLVGQGVWRSHAQPGDVQPSHAHHHHGSPGPNQALLHTQTALQALAQQTCQALWRGDPPPGLAAFTPAAPDQPHHAAAPGQATAQAQAHVTPQASLNLQRAWWELEADLLKPAKAPAAEDPQPGARQGPWQGFCSEAPDSAAATAAPPLKTPTPGDNP
jgi:hypothetical protein